MTLVSPKAQAQLDQILAKWEKAGKPGIAKKFLSALEDVKSTLAEKPESGKESPRSYAELKREGRRWLREGAYWVSYNLSDPPVISGVFLVTSDEPKQV